MLLTMQKDLALTCLLQGTVLGSQSYGTLFLVLSRKGHALLQKSNATLKRTPVIRVLLLEGSCILVCLPKALGHQGCGLCQDMLLGNSSTHCHKGQARPGESPTRESVSSAQPLLAASWLWAPEQAYLWGWLPRPSGTPRRHSCSMSCDLGHPPYSASLHKHACTM